MVLPASGDIVTYQKTIRHTGNRIVVSESIEDTVQSRELDTGSYDEHQED